MYMYIISSQYMSSLVDVTSRNFLISKNLHPSLTGTCVYLSLLCFMVDHLGQLTVAFIQYLYNKCKKVLQFKHFSQVTLSHTYPVTMFCCLRRSTLQSASHCGGCAREQADHSVLLCEKSGCQTSFPSCSNQPGKTVH